jgi:hypothetical protein
MTSVQRLEVRQLTDACAFAAVCADTGLARPVMVKSPTMVEKRVTRDNVMLTLEREEKPIN